MRAAKSITVTVASQVAVIWLDREGVRNALDGPMVEELDATLAKLEGEESIRAIVLAGKGPSFCSGIDVHWMKRMADAGLKVNTRDALAMARMLSRLDAFGKPTIARIHGSTFAGGLGLIAACDIAVAALDAEFCVSETRMGLAAATIAPYMVRAIGERQARRYLLTGERFSAAEAYRIGLVHELAPSDELDARINELLGHLLLGGPKALLTAKKNIGKAAGGAGFDQQLVDEMASMNALLRASPEGKEGINAFLERRAPNWLGPKGRKAQRPSRR